MGIENIRSPSAGQCRKDKHPSMATHHPHSAAPTAGQLFLWPVAATAPSALPPGTSGGTAAETSEPTSTPPRRRTPSFVCEVPLRVGPSEERALTAPLEAACALYNACLGEARKRWSLVKQSHAYQHARTLPKTTPERMEASRRAARAESIGGRRSDSRKPRRSWPTGSGGRQLTARVCMDAWPTRSYAKETPFFSRKYPIGPGNDALAVACSSVRLERL